MIIASLAFYLFATIAIVSAVMVIFQRNPVHSVLWLILTFFNAAGLFVLLGAEFVAMILVVVYVGAVAVLFLFVVMMLDVNATVMRESIIKYLPFGAAVGLVLLAELVLIFTAWQFAPDSADLRAQPTPPLDFAHNVEAIGLILYTEYVYLFQASGIILLVAMIGAIVLTHRRREGARKQVIADQIARSPKNTLEVVDVKPGQGLGE